VPKRRRQARIPTPDWDTHHRGALGSRLFGRTPQVYGAILIGLLLVVALGIVGYAFLDDYIQDQRRPGSTAIKVEDTSFRLDYFSDRLKIYVDQFGNQSTEAAQPSAALPAVSDLLISEEIVRRFASEKEVSATDDDIEKEIGTRLALEPDSDTFDAAFAQELARTGLTETEYRQMVEAAVLQRRLGEKFLAEVPATADSARYRQILVAADARAQELRAEVEGGGDFAALAKENSLDTTTKDVGGEVGWVPSGALDPSTEELIFGLEPKGLITIPVASGVLLVEMEEKAEDRAIEDAQKSALSQRALSDWVEEKRQDLAIVNNMDLASGDSEKIQWAVKRAYQS
jgi:foldase protein PrsA